MVRRDLIALSLGQWLLYHLLATALMMLSLGLVGFRGILLVPIAAVILLLCWPLVDVWALLPGTDDLLMVGKVCLIAVLYVGYIAVLKSYATSAKMSVRVVLSVVLLIVSVISSYCFALLVWSSC